MPSHLDNYNDNEDTVGICIARGSAGLLEYEIWGEKQQVMAVVQLLHVNWPHSIWGTTSELMNGVEGNASATVIRAVDARTV